MKPTPTLDEIDRNTLLRLMRDARLSWADLGHELGLSAPAAAERVRRLRSSGVISGFSVRVDPERVGLALTVYVAVRIGRPEDRPKFLSYVAERPEVQECHHVTGDDDYLLKIRCAGVRRLETILSEELKGTIPSVATRTTLVLSTLKDSPVLPLDGDAEKRTGRPGRKR
jgi:Lrp/AsnC family leucine-responsive transcriptional regulator